MPELLPGSTFLFEADTKEEVQALVEWAQQFLPEGWTPSIQRIYTDKSGVLHTLDISNGNIMTGYLLPIGSTLEHAGHGLFFVWKPGETRPELPVGATVTQGRVASAADTLGGILHEPGKAPTQRRAEHLEGGDVG